MIPLLSLAVASNAAYELDTIARASLLETASLRELNYFQASGDARALLARHDTEGLVLAFQGTQFSAFEIPSIFADIEVAPAYLGAGVEVHLGYYQQYLALLKVFPTTFAMPLTMTGHSMGGAIAHLAANLFAMAPTRCVSFGAPKCGNLAFWRQARLLPERVVHEADAAPLWPLLPETYEQPLPQLWLRDSGAIESLATPRPVPPDSISDHAPGAYLAALRKGAAPLT